MISDSTNGKTSGIVVRQFAFFGALDMHSAQWTAFCREAAIAGQSISAGLAALRRANYASTGLYSHAFFSLSIGLERMGKLIFIVDHMRKNNGAIPSEAALREIGHSIERLFSHIEEIHFALPDQGGRYPLPKDGIERRIISFLSEFNQKTRYYNLNYLSNPKTPANARDPIALWDAEIGKLIYAEHYKEKMRRRDATAAKFIHDRMSDFTLVLHTSEQGESLTTVEAASLQTGRNKVLQKYGTLYCAKVCRFFYMMIYEVHRDAVKNGHEVPFLDEFFFPFMNDDSYLAQRKTFPPRGQ